MFTNQQTMTAHLRTQRRQQRFADLFSSVDRVLEPTVAEVLVQSGGPAPAWTDGKTIWLNADQLPSIAGTNRRNLLAWIGANYHELGHVLYSPRADSTLTEKLNLLARSHRGIRRTYNLVEDQRQERLVFAQFPALKAYLTATAMALLTTNGKVTDSVWPLIAGRTWLPADVREAAASMYTGDATTVARLIAEYQRLADPAEGDADAALRIISDLWLELEEQGIEDTGGCGQPEPTEGDSQPAEADEDTVPVAEDMTGDSDDDDTGNGDDTGDTGNDDDADTDGTDTGGEGEGDGEGEADDTEGDDSTGTGDGEGDGDTDGDTDGDSPGTGGDTDGDRPGSGAGEGEGSDRPLDTVDDLTEALNDTVSDLMQNDADLQADLQRAMDAIDGIDDGTGSIDRTRTAQSLDVSADLVGLSHQLADHFRELVADTLPQWERYTDSGRLNVGRYTTQEVFDADVLFDRFDPGMQDETSLEIVLLVDTSGSMGSGMIRPASEMTWLIRQASEAAEANITVFTFDSQTRLLANADERTHPTKMEQLVASGGTNPTGAMRRAVGVLDASEAAHKLVIVVTDGDWSGGETVMRELSSMPDITTVGVLLTAADLTTDRDAEYYERVAERIGAMHTAAVNSPLSVVPLFAQVAEDVLLTLQQAALR